MRVKDYILNNIPSEPDQFHIFDSHQEDMKVRGKNHKDQDYVVYNYNTKRNNKPKVGDAFLYRRPGSSSKTSKFYIFGGGIINEIEKDVNTGEAIATIKFPFNLIEPLEQGKSERLENFKWTSKKKKKGWSNFWNQYGINTINKQEFWELVGDLECQIPENYDLRVPSIPDAMEENINSEELIIDFSGFNITINDEEKYLPVKRKESKLKSSHLNHSKIQEQKQKLGLQGELLVYQYLEDYFKSDKITIEHSSQVKGDGLGYDILVKYSNGKKEHIEVKTTRKPYIDGFYLTPNELRELKKLENYRIYRVYNFDPKSKKAALKIISSSDIEEYRAEPVGWKMYKKRNDNDKDLDSYIENNN